MKSRWPSPLTVCLTIGSTTVLPNPRRLGCDTGGPLRSVQLIAKMSSSRRQPTSTRPASTDSAPYLPALVASSRSAWKTLALIQEGRRVSRLPLHRPANPPGSIGQMGVKVGRYREAAVGGWGGGPSLAGALVPVPARFFAADVASCGQLLIFKMSPDRFDRCFRERLPATGF